MNKQILPNLITILRLLVGVALISSLFYWQTVTVVSLIVFLLIAITDFLDGLLARKLNAITAWGSLLDPLADKIVVAGIFTFLYHIGDLDSWFLLAFLFRELVQLGLRIRFFGEKGGRKIKTLQVSKLKTAICYFLVALVFYGHLNGTFMEMLLKWYVILISEVLILVLAYLGWLRYLFNREA